MTEKEILDEIAALEARLRDKIAERDQLNIEAIQLEEKIRNLTALFIRDAITEKGKQLTAVGLTEAINILLRKHGKPMTAADVKLGLELLGFELKRFKNPSAAVHNTLIRMAGAGQLVYGADSKTYALPERRHALGYHKLAGKR